MVAAKFVTPQSDLPGYQVRSYRRPSPSSLPSSWQMRKVSAIGSIGVAPDEGNMRLERIDPQQQKGWWVRPWNSSLEVAVGWATTGIDAPRRQTEVCRVANDTTTARVGQETIALLGNMLIIEPGEVRILLDSSENYRHFVVHTPALWPAEARANHRSASRAELGLA